MIGMLRMLPVWIGCFATPHLTAILAAGEKKSAMLPLWKGCSKILILTRILVDGMLVMLQA